MILLIWYQESQEDCKPNIIKVEVCETGRSVDFIHSDVS